MRFQPSGGLTPRAPPLSRIVARKRGDPSGGAPSPYGPSQRFGSNAFLASVGSVGKGRKGDHLFTAIMFQAPPDGEKVIRGVPLSPSLTQRNSIHKGSMQSWEGLSGGEAHRGSNSGQRRITEMASPVSPSWSCRSKRSASRRAKGTTRPPLPVRATREPQMHRMENVEWPGREALMVDGEPKRNHNRQSTDTGSPSTTMFRLTPSTERRSDRQGAGGLKGIRSEL